MSVEAMSWVFKHAPTTDGTNQLVALAIADHADEEGFCYPSIERLAQRARLSERTVRRSVESLIRLSIIEVVRGGHVVRGRFVRSHLYRLRMRKGGRHEPGLCDRGRITTVTESTATRSQSPTNHQLNHQVHTHHTARARRNKHSTCHRLFCVAVDDATICLVAGHVDELTGKVPAHIARDRVLLAFAAFVRRAKLESPDYVAGSNAFDVGRLLWDLFRTSPECEELLGGGV